MMWKKAGMRDGKTTRPKCCFEEEGPKSVVKTPKSLGRWEYNYHKQARRWFSKSKATAQHKNNTPMKAIRAGAATTMSCLAEVATLLYSSVTGPYLSCVHSLRTQTQRGGREWLKNQTFLTESARYTLLQYISKLHVTSIECCRTVVLKKRGQSGSYFGLERE